MLLVRLPAQTSLAVAPGSLNLPWQSTVIGLAPTTVMLGAWVSTTFTVRVWVSEWPWPSLLLYPRPYLPTVFASTLPDAAMLLVRLPAQTSLAVAPGSLNVPWHSSVIGWAPTTVLLGAWVSTRLTVRVWVSEWPWPSLTV